MKKDRIKEYESKIKSNQVVQDLMAFVNDNKWCDSVMLVGGAVIDILDGREPKDYDLCISHSNIFEYGYKELTRRLANTDEFRLVYTSMTAYTFQFKGNIVQVLKTNPSDFIFEIEKSRFGLKSGTFSFFDIMGYESKLLIPNDENDVIREKYLRNFKSRVKRWSEKGYKLHPVTYKSIKPFLKKDNRFLEAVKVLFTFKKYES